MKMLKKLGDNTDTRSMAHRFRTRRFAFFQSLLDTLPKPVHILDIGGTPAFWEAMQFHDNDVTITLLNLEQQSVTRKGFTSVKGDATNLAFADRSFDIVFSNSVIEHLFDFTAQQRMAAEIQRVGKNYFVQTPNYWFPLEPHWLFPFFQYLPFRVKVFLTRNFSLGHIKKIRDRNAAEKQVNEIKLLKEKELRQLFPDASIYYENILGFTKSFVAYRFKNDTAATASL